METSQRFPNERGEMGEGEGEMEGIDGRFGGFVGLERLILADRLGREIEEDVFVMTDEVEMVLLRRLLIIRSMSGGTMNSGVRGRTA